ncbi:hypothetical protein GDO81_018701 [Engystomops pustulosus]|uniref:Fucosyltransferase n=1 Tax=Engystomops pustulosus TaxID=76066 RepID=A0AAV6ZV60_ENGPU|nr:hypothetical protein GDO81_018701 [Engystomops pustulosus]
METKTNKLHRFALNTCPKKFDNSGCLYTADRTLYSSAHAVVLHHRDVCTTKRQLPKTPRPSNQRWIWFSREYPSYSPNLSFMNNLINLTMSYRVDSDIFAPYGWIENHNGAINFTIPRKTKLAAWAISNWNPNETFREVDIYGRQRQKLQRDKQTEIFSAYKFYFAFENSIHVDYITEKFWYNAISLGCVPVVMGPPRENYERFIPRDAFIHRFIPRDAFIHVDDFSSPQELASYLQSLDKDEEKYKQYFNWRSQYYVPPQDNPWTVSYCRVCKALKDAPPYRTIASIEKWFK